MIDLQKFYCGNKKTELIEILNDNGHRLGFKIYKILISLVTQLERTDFLNAIASKIMSVQISLSFYS